MTSGMLLREGLITMAGADPVEVFMPLYSVDIDALADAANAVDHEQDVIDGALAALRAIFTRVHTLWQAPATATFTSVETEFNAASTQFIAILGESVDRMRAAHRNYVETEETNRRNMIAQSGGG